MSYGSTWQYLRNLTEQARYLRVVQEGHWLWAYDNINIHRRARHERQGKRDQKPTRRITIIVNNTSFIAHHSQMLNATSRLANKVQHLPEWEVDWEDSKPQNPRSTLQITDILPNEADGRELHEQAVNFVMRLLVEVFESLRGLARYAPQEKNLHPVATSEVVPMELLFRDEKYTSENVEILKKIAMDANLHGNPQV